MINKDAARTVVTLAIATFSVWWVNRGKREKSKKALPPSFVKGYVIPQCPSCGGDGILQVVWDKHNPTMQVGWCRTCIRCGECFGYEDVDEDEW